MKGGAAKAVRGAQAGLSSPTRGPPKKQDPDCLVVASFLYCKYTNVMSFRNVSQRFTRRFAL